MNEMENIGGVGLKEVIYFQTQIMMGSQFNRIINKNCTQNDLFVACLRMGWNDAFRHTSENVKIGKENNSASVIEAKSKEIKQDYICSLLEDQIVISAFKDFLITDNKQDAWKKHKEKLINLLGEVKKTSGTRALCFGHFQKMFNIAAKLYLCIYICRKYLGLDDKLFDSEIIEALSYADCPIDSVIMNQFPKVKQGSWSKYDDPNGNYHEMQTAIAERLRNKEEGKSNLYYDFKYWNQTAE